MNRKTLGIILVAAVVIFAAAYQWLGPGLISVRHPATPPEMAAQGITMVSQTVYNFALFPLVVLGAIGFALVAGPKQFWRRKAARL